MCTIPPPAPPPPPLETSKQPIKLYNHYMNRSCNSQVCGWASSYPQLVEACVRNTVCLHEPPFKYHYKQHQSILQEGPTCGIVALAMLVNAQVSPTEILEIAQEAGYSNNGEMFSCNNMRRLAEKILRFTGSSMRCELKRGDLFSQETIERLLNGAILLVPYDADFNHSPCLRNGHKAHWALVCGIMIVNEPESPLYVTDSSNIYVMCKHGKSNHLALWYLQKLEASNKNLWEFAPSREDDGLIYVLPDEGVGSDDGLRDQFLIFY